MHIIIDLYYIAIYGLANYSYVYSCRVLLADYAWLLQLQLIAISI